MMPHAFLAWGWTVYLAEMMDFGDMEAVKEYLAPCMFLDGSSPFCFTMGRPYFPMRDKLAQVQADCCEFVDLVTREERPEQGGRAPCFTER